MRTVPANKLAKVVQLRFYETYKKNVGNIYKYTKEMLKIALIDV